MPVLPKILCLPALSLALGPAVASAGPDDLAPSTDAEEAGLGYHPWLVTPKGPKTIDLGEAARRPGDYVAEPVQQPDFGSLDEHMIDEGDDAATHDEVEPALAGKVPDGWVQRGNVVLPEDVAFGAKQVETDPIFAVEDFPGNKYPRKHTLFLNFNGGMLFSGKDNSAEDKSNLAKQGVYPTYQGGESKALSVVQAVQNDLASYGVRVIYDFRPSKTVPYTMEMMGGDWSDTNIDSPAGGVAPGADCGALGQRHVVYTFSAGSATREANTASQEAGHAWGLDHIFNCDSVMSYCSSGDASFQNSCAGLCESQCQGPNSAGCRLTHEMFCGVGNDQQNDHAEMEWIFGGNEPDMEAPTVEIVEPADGTEIETGGDVDLRALVDDDYGGFGWKLIVVKDGETLVDQVDYFKENLDDDYRVAFNLTNLEAGTYELSIEAEDHADHVTRETVTVHVSGSAGSGGTGGSDGGSASDGGTDGIGTVGGTGGADGTGSGSGGSQADDDSGCSVQGRPGSGALAWMMMLLGLAALRRREPN